MEESYPWMEQVEFELKHPTDCKPGTEGKVSLLAARYANGVPLWVDGDVNSLDASPPGNSEGIRTCRRRLGQDWIEY